MYLKEIYGEFPVDRLLVVGPGFWQAGTTWADQQLVGDYRYESIPHHLIHAYFGHYPTRMEFGGAFFFPLGEGYPTYSEGIMTAEIADNPIWSEMLFERKSHYLRGMHFDGIDRNMKPYVLGFATTYLMDNEIRDRTGGSKGIDDLMVAIWQRYNGPNAVSVSDEQVLGVLKDLAGSDWHEFYRRNVLDTSNLDVSSLDALKPDFRVFLGAISDYWYGGHPSAYFVNQELISGAGDFDMGVRFQQPFGTNSFLLKFAIQARELKDVSHEALSEKDIEKAMCLVTGKDHSDFFEFYRSQGFTVDPLDVTEYLRTFHYPGGGDSPDNAARTIPHAIGVGQSTPVTLELVDPAFAAADELLLQVAAYDVPEGLTTLGSLVSGRGVSFRGQGEFTDGTGRAVDAIFALPKTTWNGKTHTEFNLNLPQDAGVMRFSLNARTGQATQRSPLGGFVGTKKVFFQDTITVPAARQLSVFVNGLQLRPDVQPYISGGRTFVPVRALGEALGADRIDWDESARSVILGLSGRTVVLVVGQDTAMVDGRQVPLDAPIQMKGDRTFIPLRFVSETLGDRVDWYERTQMVWVTGK